MFTTNAACLFKGHDYQPVYDRPAPSSRFELTAADRIGIEKLLRDGVTRRSPNPNLLEGFLRHKLRVSCGAPDPAPNALVTSGRRVKYMISGGGAREGLLTMQPDVRVDRIEVATLLGATLIGMRSSQKMPLLTDDGQIEIVLVLDVTTPPRPRPA